MKSGKVWGNTKQILKTPFVEFHRIVVENGMRCSKHKHEHKWNAFFVENGVLDVHVFSETVTGHGLKRNTLARDGL